MVRRCGIELGGGRPRGVRPVVLVPSAAADPLPLRHLRCTRPHGVDHRLRARRAAQVHFLQALAETEHVTVRVVQAGNHRATACVDHLRRGSAKREGLRIGADDDDAIAADGERPVPRARVGSTV